MPLSRPLLDDDEGLGGSKTFASLSSPSLIALPALVASWCSSSNCLQTQSRRTRWKRGRREVGCAHVSDEKSILLRDGTTQCHFTCAWRGGRHAATEVGNASWQILSKNRCNNSGRHAPARRPCTRATLRRETSDSITDIIA